MTLYRKGNWNFHDSNRITPQITPRTGGSVGWASGCYQGLKVLQYAVLSPTSQPRAFHENHGNKNGNSSNKQIIVHCCFKGNGWYFQPVHNAISDVWVTWRLIGHFQITFGLFFKASSGAHPFLMKISFHLHVNERKDEHQYSLWKRGQR